MKIEIKQEKEEKFEPITLSIKIETKEEWDAIYEMAFYTDSIPELVKGCHFKIVREFVFELHHQLTKERKRLITKNTNI